MDTCKFTQTCHELHAFENLLNPNQMEMNKSKTTNQVLQLIRDSDSTRVQDTQPVTILLAFHHSKENPMETKRKGKQKQKNRSNRISLFLCYPKVSENKCKKALNTWGQERKTKARVGPNLS